MPRTPVWVVTLGALLLSFVLMGCPGPQPVDPKPEANFEVRPTVGTAPLEVQFTDLSSQGASPITSWVWDFGDGSRSTRENPAKTFNTRPGDNETAYTVSLTVTSARGSDTMSVPAAVTVRRPSSFGSIGPDGGTVSELGVSIAVPAGALEKDVAFGVSEEAAAFSLNTTESLQVISQQFTITHSSDSDAFFTFRTNDQVEPSHLTLPYNAQALSGAEIDREKVLILARLDSGITVPILGEVDEEEEEVSVPLTRLPARAKYAVAYRRDGYESTVPFGGEVGGATDFDWHNQWRVNLSDAMIQQLTALRLGDVENLSPYTRRDYGDDQTAATEAVLIGNVRDLRDSYTGVGMRTPALAADENTYALILYNMSSSYTTQYSSFQEVTYAAHAFGQLVVDPLQLLNVSIHNGNALSRDGAQDLAQAFSFSNAFAEELFRAAFEGYEVPEITIASPADRDAMNNVRDVHLLEGLKEGTAAYLGQWADGSNAARGFEENEYASLSTQLFYPIDADLPGYAVAAQDFFFYIWKNYVPQTPLDFLVTTSASGLIQSAADALNERQDELDALPNGGSIDFDDGLLLVYQHVDEGMKRRLDVKLTEAYWDYLRGRAIENGSPYQLRPSDAGLDAFTLNETRFSSDAVLERTLERPGSEIDVLAENVDALRDIPPLAARVVVLTVNPGAARMTLTFNEEDWFEDELGNRMGVAVYVNGLDHVATLGIDQSVITVRDLPGDQQADDVEVVILACNLNLESANSLSFNAKSQPASSTNDSEILADYVHRDDGNFSYELTDEMDLSAGATGYVLDMTSGTWRSGADLEDDKQALWRHKIAIVKPPLVENETSMLMVSGGSTGSDVNNLVFSQLLPFAMSTASVVSLVTAVPNEPLRFSDFEEDLSEDGIIAYSYDKYMLSYAAGEADNTWPALLPMTRAAVRAMDAVQDFMFTLENTPIEIDDFVVTGASKRGWTTWLTAAADTRVKAIMPMVIDVLNMDLQMQHHYNAYGSYSTSIADYVYFNVFERFGDPEGDALLRIVDPFSYRGILDMPKYVVNSTGDQFFLPDSSQFYFNGLSGEKYIHYAPNTDHGLSEDSGYDEGVIKSLLAFYSNVVRDDDSPAYGWTLEEDEAEGRYRITVQTEIEPTEVLLWQAYNPERRDFRQNPRNVNNSIPPGTVGPEWTSSVIDSANPTRFVGEVEIPEEGWRGFYVMLRFLVDGLEVDPGFGFDSEAVDFVCTTEVKIVPDIYPEFN